MIKTQMDYYQDELTIERKISNYEVSTFVNLESDVFKELNNDIEIDINDTEEDVIFINVWATWCGPCIAEMPHFERFITRYNNKSIKFLFVSNESVNTIKKFQEKNNYKLPYYKIDSLKNNFFNHKSIPTNYIIDKANKIVFKFTGSANWNNELYQNLVNTIIE